MQERKFTDTEVYQRSAIAATVMFIIFTILIDIVLGAIAGCATFLAGAIVGRQVKVDK